MVPTQRSAYAFAFGALTGVRMTRIPSPLKISSKAARELAVAVTNQILDRCGSFAERPNEVARLLGYPGTVWVGRAGGEMYAAVIEFDEKEDVEPTKRDRLEREEVDGENASRLRAEELPPRKAAPLTRRAEIVIAQDLADCGGRNGSAEILELSGDSLIAPAWVLAREAQNSATVASATAGRPGQRWR